MGGGESGHFKIEKHAYQFKCNFPRNCVFSFKIAILKKKIRLKKHCEIVIQSLK